MGDVSSGGRGAGKSWAQELGSAGKLKDDSTSADLLPVPLAPRSQQQEPVSSELLLSEVPFPSHSCLMTNTSPTDLKAIQQPPC